MERNSVENRLSELEKQYSRIEEKLDLIISIFKKDVAPNCAKMSGHIDFVENVYDNVKNPLGYLCNKVGSLIPVCIEILLIVCRTFSINLL